MRVGLTGLGEQGVDGHAFPDRVQLRPAGDAVDVARDLDNRFEGVAIGEIVRRVRPKPEAKYVMVHADPDYTTNLALSDLVDGDVVLALRHDGQDLAPDHGGPLRLVVPKLYFWKSAKWVRGFEFLDVNPPGFWEVNGYHMHADPWAEERYSDQETHAMQTMRAEAARRLRAR